MWRFGRMGSNIFRYSQTNMSRFILITPDISNYAENSRRGGNIFRCSQTIYDFFKFCRNVTLRSHGRQQYTGLHAEQEGWTAAQVSIFCFAKYLEWQMTEWQIFHLRKYEAIFWCRPLGSGGVDVLHGGEHGDEEHGHCWDQQVFIIIVIIITILAMIIILITWSSI